MPSVITPWILAARPKTLGAAIAPVLVGTVLGWRIGGHFSLLLALATLGSCLCLQIAVNFFNDAVDGLKGSDTKERLGPTRITASGMVAPSTVLWAGAGVLLLAGALAFPLFLTRGWPILAIGIPSLYFCYGYTGGPWPLAYRGMGELFVILFFGLVAVGGSAFVQSGGWHVESLIAGLQVGMLSTVLIAINNLRDVEEDTKTGKRTLAVRFGQRFAVWEIALLHGVTLILSFYWLFSKEWVVPALATSLTVSLLGTVVIKGIQQKPSGVFNKYLAIAGMNLLVFSIIFTLGLLFFV